MRPLQSVDFTARVIRLSIKSVLINGTSTFKSDNMTFVLSDSVSATQGVQTYSSELSC